MCTSPHNYVSWRCFLKKLPTSLPWNLVVLFFSPPARLSLRQSQLNSFVQTEVQHEFHCLITVWSFFSSWFYSFIICHLDLLRCGFLPQLVDMEKKTQKKKIKKKNYLGHDLNYESYHTVELHLKKKKELCFKHLNQVALFPFHQIGHLYPLPQK